MDTLVRKNKEKLIKEGIEVIVPIETHDINTDPRPLIPFIKHMKQGLMNRDYEIIVPAQYDFISTTRLASGNILVAIQYSYAYERKNAYPQVYPRYKYGVLSPKGDVILPTEYSGIHESGDNFIVREAYGHAYKGRFSLLDKDGNTLIPFGEEQDKVLYEQFRKLSKWTIKIEGSVNFDEL